MSGYLNNEKNNFSLSGKKILLKFEENSVALS